MVNHKCFTKVLRLYFSSAFYILSINVINLRNEGRI